MAQPGASSPQPRISAPSYLVAGVLFYGLVGWLLDQWLGTRFLVAVGVLLGGGLGTYMMIVLLRRQTEADADSRHSSTEESE
jgi:F0F1-type ATP synthase assembly protein I